MHEMVIVLLAAIVIFGLFFAVLLLKSKRQPNQGVGCQHHTGAGQPHQCQCGRNPEAASTLE